MFTLDTGAPQSAIDEVFEFVEDDCDLALQELEAEVPRRRTRRKPPVPAAGERSPRRTRPSARAACRRRRSDSIRVDVDKVDRLVNLVGEMVITQAMLTEQAACWPRTSTVSLIRASRRWRKARGSCRKA